MNIDLSKKQDEEVFQVDGDKRFFKKKQYNINSFYVYAYNQNARVWRLDYSQARKLAGLNAIQIVSSKIVHVVDDVMFLNAYARNEFKNNYSTGFIQQGKRYIAEATITYPTKDTYQGTNGLEDLRHVPEPEITMTRTSSAGADNTHPSMPSYAPEMACKRAVIKCIIDCLNLEDIVEEYYGFREIEEVEKEGQPIPNVANVTTVTDEKISDLQIEQLRILDPKFTPEKYANKTQEQAGKIIMKLKNKPVKKSRKAKKKKK